ncbi:MAG: aldo/keto reductase [Planctomycetota bacterium]|jgi:diketogulonate reductase-like aldo/keto reductase
MNEFQVAKDGVDPNLVPQRVLNTGAKMPAIGLGTFGSDRFSGEDIAEAVKGAISIGYRHIDCASIYGNENLIGQSLKEVMQGGIKRQELWITSKLWNDMHSEGDVLISCKKSLEDLQLDYLNLYLVHWPFPNYHPPGCDVTSRSPNAKPYIHENYMKTWRQMEKLVEMGLAKHIGTSNMTIPKLKLLLRDANIKPACNEMEQHPHFQQPELFQFCMENNAQRLNVHPAVVCVKWAVQRGQIPIPFSIYRNEYLSNLKSTVQNPLTDEEMKAVAGIDKNCRLIKAQVFLWKKDQTWEDLWDINGQITPP